MPPVDKFRCSICGKLNCAHVRDKSGSNKLLRNELLRRMQRRFPITSEPASTPHNNDVDRFKRNAKIMEMVRKKSDHRNLMGLQINKPLTTEPSYHDFLKQHHIKKYDFKVSRTTARVDIFVKHYWVSLKKLILATEYLKPVTTVVIYNKYTFKQWLQSIGIYRFTKYHYLKLKRKYRKINEPLTKFDMMAGN